MKFAEVHYFTIVSLKNILKAVAVVSLYGEPHPDLLAMSSNTYRSVKHLRDTGIQVIPIKSIQSVVAMIPDLQFAKYQRKQEGIHLDRWHVVEKPGLKVTERFLKNTERTEEEISDD